MPALAIQVSSNDAALGHERCLLAYLMTEPDACDRFLHRISPAIFSAPHGKIIEAICDVHDEREKVNLLTVSNRLSDKGVLAACGGRPGITAIATETTSEEIAESALDCISTSTASGRWRRSGSR